MAQFSFVCSIFLIIDRVTFELRTKRVKNFRDSSRAALPLCARDRFEMFRPFLSIIAATAMMILNTMSTNIRLEMLFRLPVAIYGLGGEASMRNSIPARYSVTSQANEACDMGEG